MLRSLSLPAGPAPAEQWPARLRELLFGNILPFWYPRMLDTSTGGFCLHHDRRGRYLGVHPHSLVAQARTTWFFSRLSRSSLGSRSDNLAAARHGIDFLRERFLDTDYGGYYWELEAGGGAPARPHKHLLGQAFALYALSEYAAASGDSGARKLAVELFQLIEQYGYDQRHGGYCEFHARDWTNISHSMPDYRTGRLPGAKSRDTHLHLLEALTTYYRLTGDEKAKQRILELLELELYRMQSAFNLYTPQWEPLPNQSSQTMYGHELESIQLMIEARETLGQSQECWLGHYRARFDDALAHAWDGRRQGFYYSGPPGVAATNRVKVWWVQAEGLLAALKLYWLTAFPAYLACFQNTLQWIESFQADWAGGEWHARITPWGFVRGDRAGPWKTPYHNGRAVIECLELLEGRWHEHHSLPEAARDQ